MSRAREGLERASLALLLAAAAASTGVPGWPLLAALALAAVAASFRLGAAAGVLAMRAQRLAGDLLVGATAVFAFIWTLYPVVSEETLRRIAAPLSYALGVPALFGLASAASWPPARTLIPSALSLLLLGAQLQAPGPRFVLCVAVAGLAGAAFLLCERPATDRRAVPPRLVTLAAFLGAVAGLGLLIARFLPWAQPLVEAATANLVSPPASTGYAGFSLTSRLGDIEELALSRRVVLRAYTDTPQRLRGRAFTRFDGRAWSAEPARGAVDLLATQPASLPSPLPGFFEDFPGSVFSVPGQGAAAASLVRTRFVSSAADVEAVLAPLAPLMVSLPKDGARLDDQGILTASPAGPIEIYGIVNRRGGPGAGQAAEDVTLQLPAALDPRTVALAESLGGRGGAPEERVRRTLRHLERCCRYSLKVPRPPGKDVVAGFLFESQRGYCEYFASAAALLLRLQGVPTRYVTGFNVRDESVVAGHYVVRESDAHAWLESYLPGQGWLEFDPTPSAQYSELHSQADGGALAALLERWKALASEAGARLRAGSLPTGLRWLLRVSATPLAGLLALALVAWLLRRRGAARGEPPCKGDARRVDPRVQELLVRVDRLLSARGHPRPPARAPQEHLEALPESALEAAARAEAARAVGCFYRARYGGERPAAQEVDELLRRLPTA